MLFSYHWLRELSGTKRSPEKLAELLLTHAFEVESITPYAHGLENVVIGKVLKLAKHPNADRLRVATVEVGKNKTHTIVCGAPNVAVGQKVAVILPGGKLPDGSVIEETELRGVPSQGMICSERELGLGTSHKGILVLDKNAPIGKSFVSFAGLDDVILDVKILPDRSCDALSYRGLAHEIAALEGVEAAFVMNKKSLARVKKSTKVPAIKVMTENCARYTLVAFDDIALAESDLSIKVRLLVSGLRSVNRVVDLTNYLMLETGQPTHAFDAEKIGRGGVVVRMAKPHEKLTLLDGKTVTLGKEDIVIADSKKAIALAGIMGGMATAVTEKTKKIVVEIAHFDAQTIRKTRKRLNLLSDASFRFERGLDLDRGASVEGELIRLFQDRGEARYVGSRSFARGKTKVVKISLPQALVEKMLGVNVPLFEMVQYLALLGLSVKKIANKKELEVTVPGWRPDLQDAWDLVEEIGRLRGYEALPSISPLLPLVPTPFSEQKQFEHSLKTKLASLGFDETLSYSFYNENCAKESGAPLSSHLSLENPTNSDQAFLRTSLLPNLVLQAEGNARYFETFSLFEWGSVFEKGKSAPLERKKLSLLVYRPLVKTEAPFSILKGYLENLFESLGVRAESSALAETPPLFHPTQSAVLSLDGKTVGYVGELHPVTSDTLHLKGGVALAELDGEILASLSFPEKTFVPLQRFPYAYRDISLIGPKKVLYAEVEALLKEMGGPLLVSAELFDRYIEGEEGSFAFHLAFGLPDRTIKSEEMDQTFDAIVEGAQARLGLRLRLS